MSNRKPRQFKSRSRESVQRRLDLTENYNRKGVHFLNPNLRDVRIVRPDVWETGGRFTFRIWPLLDPESPTTRLMNGRTDIYGSAGLQGMAMSEIVPVASYVGMSRDSAALLSITGAEQRKYDQCSFIISRGRGESVDGVPYEYLPYVRIDNACRSAVKANNFGSPKKGKFAPKWNGLLPADTRKNPAVPKIKYMSFAVASLYENGVSFNLLRERVQTFKDGRKGVKDIKRNGIPLGEAEGDPLVVVAMTISAARKVFDLCNVPREDYAGSLDVDPSKAFKYGDPTGRFIESEGVLKGGLFFSLYNPKKTTIKSNTTYKGSAQSPGEEEGGFGSYECAVARSIKAPNGSMLTADMSAAQVDNVFSRQLFLWPSAESEPSDSDYLLRVPGVEEQAELLARAFRLIPSFLQFCWSETPEYLRFDSVRSLLNDRTTIDLGKSSKPEYDDDDEDEDEDDYDGSYDDDDDGDEDDEDDDYDDEPRARADRSRASRGRREADRSGKRDRRSDRDAERRPREATRPRPDRDAERRVKSAASAPEPASEVDWSSDEEMFSPEFDNDSDEFASPDADESAADEADEFADEFSDESVEAADDESAAEDEFEQAELFSADPDNDESDLLAMVDGDLDSDLSADFGDESDSADEGDDAADSEDSFSDSEKAAIKRSRRR